MVVKTSGCSVSFNIVELGLKKFRPWVQICAEDENINGFG